MGGQGKEAHVTNPTATVSECLQVHGSLESNEIDELSEHWASLDTWLKSFDPTQVAMDLFVKDRDTVSQHITLEAKIANWPMPVATTSEPELENRCRLRVMKLMRVSTRLNGYADMLTDRYPPYLTG